MAKVLFAHGHLLRFDPKLFEIGKPYPPLATLFAAAYVRSHGHAVALFDPMLDRDTSGIATALGREAPDVVVLYDDSFNWFTKMCLSRMREAALAIVEQAHARGVTVIVAGHDAADHPERFLDRGASFVIRGEGEITLNELLNALSDAKGDLSRAKDRATAIAGLILRHKGMVRRTVARKLLQDLDVLPLPAWDLVDIERYRAFWKRRHGYFSLNVVTTRGCPYLCNWCSKPVYGNTYHSRSPASVVAELTMLRDAYRPDHIWFCDDILGLKSSWLLAFAREVQDAKVKTRFLCQTRADLMTPQNVQALADAGAHEVWLGVESGAQRILDAMQKGITVEQTRMAVTHLRSHRVRVGFFVQFGYGDENWNDVSATRSLLRELLPDDVGISVSYPLPGTRYFEQNAHKMGEKDHWSDSRDLDPLVPATFPRKVYPTLSRMVHAEIRTWRGARALRAILKAPTTISAVSLKEVAEMRKAASWLFHRLRLEAQLRRN